MIITLNFIVVFALFVLPGLVFRRFFFMKQFSKQLSLKVPIGRTLIYSLIPSLFIQVLLFQVSILVFPLIFEKPFEIDLGYWVDYYKCIADPNFTFVGSDIDELWIVFKNLINIAVSLYIVFALLGLASFLIIRQFGLDLKYKLLRYDNHWYYVFSSEILQFEKFKKAINSDLFLDSKVTINQKENLHTKKRNKYTKVDILVEGEYSSNFYSGIVVDYDLNPENNQELQRLYLKNTVRYKKHKKAEDRILGKTTSVVNVPGDFFIVLGKEIKNINVNYIPSVTEVRKLNWKHKTIKTMGVINSFLIFLLIIPLFIIDFPKFKNEILESINLLIFGSHWTSKLIFWFYLDALLSVFVPVKKFKVEKDGKIQFVNELVTASQFWKRLFVFFGLGGVVLVVMQFLNFLTGHNYVHLNAFWEFLKYFAG